MGKYKKKKERNQVNLKINQSFLAVIGMDWRLLPSQERRGKKKIFEWIVKSSKPIACVYSSIINEKERWMARSVDFRVCVCVLLTETRDWD